jgi:hypothetical protein
LTKLFLINERMPIMKVKFQYITDIEGDLKFFKTQIKKSQVVRFATHDENSLEFVSKDPSELFVFGGDVCDRGEDITIVNMLVKLKEEYPDRVILIVGNRDANKTRFSNELPLLPCEVLDDDIDAVVKPEYGSKSYREYLDGVRHGEERLKNTPINRLKWILACTMGAPLAFECRRKELMRLKDSEISEEEVYSSFRESVEPGGFMRKYLAQAQIAAVIGDTLIVHGGVSSTNVGKVPNNFVAFERDLLNSAAVFRFEKPDFLTFNNVQEWTIELNRWYKSAIKRWVSNAHTLQSYHYSNFAPASPLQHTAFELGSFFKGQLPVTGNFLKEGITPWPTTEDVTSFLNKGGVNRLLVGHQPNGGTPLALFGTTKTAVDQHSFQVFTCDTLYGNRKAYDPECGAEVRATDPRGSSYAAIHVCCEVGRSSYLDVQGVDGFDIPYARTINFPRGESEDPFIGRVLQLDNKYYTVRINDSGSLEKPYVLTHTEKNYTISQRLASKDELLECELREAFLTTNSFSMKEHFFKSIL